MSEKTLKELFTESLVSVLAAIDKTLKYSSQDFFIADNIEYTCKLSEQQKTTALPITYGALHSCYTILELSKGNAFQLRDIYVLTRSVIESLINSAYIIVSDNTVAEKAIRYTRYKYYKHGNLEKSYGEINIKVESSSNLSDEELILLKKEFDKKTSWCGLNIPKRINAIKENGYRTQAHSLFAAYVNIYDESSEIIHGSPFGYHFMITTHLQGKEYPDFVKSKDMQLEWIYICLINAVGSYVSIFNQMHSMSETQELIDKLIRAGMEMYVDRYKFSKLSP